MSYYDHEVLRSQKEIGRSLERIGDLLEKLVKLKKKEQSGMQVDTSEVETETTFDIEL